MGTRGQMFWLKPGLPNSLEPGKRPRTTLSPSFALRDGKAWMAFGTPGGEQQDQWSLIHVPAHGPPQHEHPGSDRRAVVPYRALAEQFLAARRPSRQGGHRRSLRRRGVARSARRAVTTPAKATTGARAGCPARAWSRTGRCSRAPIRAACKVTRWAAECGRWSNRVRCIRGGSIVTAAAVRV